MSEKKKFAPPPAPPLPPITPRNVTDASQNAPTRAVSIRKVVAEKKPSSADIRTEETPGGKGITDSIRKFPGYIEDDTRRGSGSVSSQASNRSNEIPQTPGIRTSVSSVPSQVSAEVISKPPTKTSKSKNIPPPPPLPLGPKAFQAAPPPAIPMGSKTLQAPPPPPLKSTVLQTPKSSKKKRGQSRGGTAPVATAKENASGGNRSKTKKHQDRNQLNANLSILISGSESDSEASNIDSDSIQKGTDLTELETVVFDSVTSGSLLTVKEALEKSNFDFNRRNIVGYTILHISIRRQDEEMVKLILGKGGKSIWPSVLKDTLLHAIKEVNVDLVKTILHELDNRSLKIEDKLPQRVMLKDYIANRKSINEEIEFMNSEFHEDTSPLMLSAMCDSYDLVALFHERGHLLQKPPPYIPPNKDRLDANKHDIGPLRASYRLLHYYQACSKPAFLSFTVNHCDRRKDEDKCDPILVAFNLIVQVREEAEKDVFKKEYLEIAEELQQFACNMIQQCRTTDEVEELLKQPEGYKQASPFPRLSMAIDLELKNFVAHRHCQQILYRYWAGKDWPEWRTKDRLSIAGNALFRILFWPLIAIWMCLERSSKFGKMMSTPVSCFLNNMASYIYFVSFVLVMNVWNPDGPNHRGLPRTGVEYPLIVWVAGFWLSSAKQLIMRSQSYLGSPGAWVDMIMNTLFLVAFILWIATPTEPALDRKHWKADDTTLIAEIFFSFASILAYGRILRIFQLNPRLGPLITSIGRMFYDVLNALLFFFIIIVAFAIGLSRLYRPYIGWEDIDQVTKETITQSEAFTTFPKAVQSLYWSIFSMGSASDTRIIPRTIVSIRNESITSIAHLRYVEHFGNLIYAAYHVIVTLILLNMLLCMMSKTYEAVNGNVGVEWNFARAKIWLSHGLDFVNPSPLNFLPPIVILCTKKPKKSSKYLSEDQYHKLIKKLVQRYFRAKAELAIKEPATMESIEALQEDIAEFYSLLEKTDVEHYERQLTKTGVFPSAESSQSSKQKLHDIMEANVRRAPVLPLPSYAPSISTLLSDASAESDAESISTTSTIVPARRQSQPYIPSPPPLPAVTAPWKSSTKIPPQPTIPSTPTGTKPAPPPPLRSATPSGTSQEIEDAKIVHFPPGRTPSDRSGVETPSK